MKASQTRVPENTLSPGALHKLSFLFIGLNISYLFKIYQGLSQQYIASLFLCSSLNIFFFLLIHLITKNPKQIPSLFLSFKDRLILFFTLLALVVNFEVFWKAFLTGFPSASLVGPVLLYFGALIPIFSYSRFLDQAVHWALITSYSAMTHFSTNTFTPDFALVYCLGAVPLIACLNQNQKIQQRTSGGLNANLLSKLFPLFLNHTDNLYFVVDRGLDILTASKAFIEDFGITSEFLKAPNAKGVLQKISKLECTQQIVELTQSALLCKRENSCETECQTPGTGIQNYTLKDIVEILFNNSFVLRRKGYAWDQTNMVKTQAFIDKIPIELSFAFLEEEKEREEYLVFHINSNPKENKENKEKDSSLTVKEVASIVHDLRTPLNGTIFLLQQALDKGKIPSEVRHDFLEPSLESSKRLSYIINDLLDFAQILEGKLRLTFEAFDLEKVLKHPIQIIRTLAKAKGVEVSLKVDPEIPQIITSDQNRLVQIIYNLLGNALKFTNGGRIDLYVNRSETKPKHLEFTVKDTGVGIKPEDLCKLFKTFEKIDNWQDSTVGAGLGLCISNAIVKSLGDDEGINVESQYQIGSKFSFNIQDKTLPTDAHLNSKRSSQRYSQFSPFSKQEIEKNVYVPGGKTLSRASTGEYSLRETVLKAQTKVSNVNQRKTSLLTKLESSEVISDFTCHQNPTVHFDFNNVSSQLIELNQRKNSDSLQRLPSTIHELETASKRYPKESDLYVERLRRSTLQPEKASRSLMSSPVCSCYQIVAVDDEPMNLMALKLMCLNMGVGIKCFNRGEEAIEYFNKGDTQRSRCMKCKGPLFMLMDCNMPGKDGFETSKELQKLMEKGKMPQIPILACSADDSPLMKEAVTQKGMNGCVPKPVEKIKLQSLVNYYERNTKY